MVGVGLGLVWAGYTAALYGYCLIRGYNVSPKQMFTTWWPPVSPDKSPAAFAVGQALKDSQAPAANAAGRALGGLALPAK